MFKINPAEEPRDVACTVNDLADFMQQFFENCGEKELRLRGGASSGMIAILEMIKAGVNYIDVALENERCVTDKVKHHYRAAS